MPVSSRPGDVLAAGHAEGGDLGVLQRQLADLLEVLGVLGVGERIAALDVVDAQLVEPARDEQLVLEREVDALALAAVAQRRVVDLDACHREFSDTGPAKQKTPEPSPQGHECQTSRPPKLTSADCYDADRAHSLRGGNGDRR